MKEPANIDQRPTRVRWFIYFLACAASWLLYLHRYSWGVIKPSLMQEFPGITDVQWGWLDSVFMATYGFGQIPGGAAGDFLGPHAVLTTIILVWTALAAAVAWVPGTPLMLGAVRGLFGLSQAGAYPVLSQVTRRWCPLRVRTSLQGAVTAMGRIGGASASFFIAAIFMGWLGLTWRAAVLTLAVPGVLLALLTGLVFRNSPRTHPWCNDGERRLIEADDEPIKPDQKPSLRLDRAGLITVAALLAYAFLSTFADQLFVYWIPLFLKEGKGLSDRDMGLFAMLPLLGGAAGGLVSGVLNDFMLRIGGKRLARSGVAFTGKCLAAVFIALSVPIADGRLVMAVLFLCKFFGDWSLVSQWGATTDIAGKAAGTVFGFINTVGTVGGFAAGPLMGYLKRQQGWEGLFFAVAGVLFLSACCWLFIDSSRPLVVQNSAAEA